jgi:hypothetical protein
MTPIIPVIIIGCIFAMICSRLIIYISFIVAMLLVTVPPNNLLSEAIEHTIKEQYPPSKGFLDYLEKKIVTKIAGFVSDPIVHNYHVLKIANIMIPGGEMKFIGIFNKWVYIGSFSSKN